MGEVGGEEEGGDTTCLVLATPPFLQLQEHLHSSLLGRHTQLPAQESSKKPAPEGRPDTMLAQCRTHCRPELWRNPRMWKEPCSEQVWMLSLEWTPVFFKCVTMSPHLANPHCLLQGNPASLDVYWLLNVSLAGGIRVTEGTKVSHKEAENNKESASWSSARCAPGKTAHSSMWTTRE